MGQNRSFGNWGEWHVSHFNGSQMPSEEVQMDMLTYYASIFHKTQLVLPSNGSGVVYEHALSLGITKRDKTGLLALGFVAVVSLLRSTPLLMTITFFVTLFQD